MGSRGGPWYLDRLTCANVYLKAFAGRSDSDCNHVIDAHI